MAENGSTNLRAKTLGSISKLEQPRELAFLEGFRYTLAQHCSIHVENPDLIDSSNVMRYTLVFECLSS